MTLKPAKGSYTFRAQSHIKPEPAESNTFMKGDKLGKKSLVKETVKTLGISSWLWMEERER